MRNWQNISTSSAVCCREDKYKFIVTEIENLTDVESQEVFRIIYKNQCTYTKNMNGIFINLANLTDDNIEQIHRYIKFCKESKKEMILHQEFKLNLWRKQTTEPTSKHKNIQATRDCDNDNDNDNDNDDDDNCDDDCDDDCDNVNGDANKIACYNDDNDNDINNAAEPACCGDDNYNDMRTSSISAANLSKSTSNNFCTRTKIGSTMRFYILKKKLLRTQSTINHTLSNNLIIENRK